MALMLALRTACKLQLDPNKIWNLTILMLFTALLGSRLLLVIANWTVLRRHPVWMLSLAMIHHPLFAGIGTLLGISVAVVYTRAYRLPFRITADALAAPAALGLAFEQAGALLAGSGFGTGTNMPWAVTYTDPLVEQWNGAPLYIPVHPVQAYAALCVLTIAIGLMLWLPYRSQHGDLAGTFLLATGAVLFITELWRDPIGRGALFQGMLKGPQVGAIFLVLVGAMLLWDRPSQHIAPALVPDETILPNPAEVERPSHG